MIICILLRKLHACTSTLSWVGEEDVEEFSACLREEEAVPSSTVRTRWANFREHTDSMILLSRGDTWEGKWIKTKIYWSFVHEIQLTWYKKILSIFLHISAEYYRLQQRLKAPQSNLTIVLACCSHKLCNEGFFPETMELGASFTLCLLSALLVLIQCRSRGFKRQPRAISKLKEDLSCY